METIVNSETLNRGAALAERVSRQGRRCRAMSCLMGSLSFLRTLALGALILWIIDFQFTPEPGIRILLAWTMIGILAALAAVRIALPLARVSSPVEEALFIEKAIPQNNLLSSAMEFYRLLREGRAGNRGISLSAMALSVDQASEFNENQDFTLCESLLRNSFLERTFLVAWAVLLAAVIFFPQEAQYSLSRYENPRERAQSISRRSYRVLPGDTTLVAGQDLEIQVSCKGLLPYSPALQLIWPASGVTQEIAIPVNRTSGVFGLKGVFSHTLQVPGNELRYRVVDEDGPGKIYIARVMERPSITSIKVRYTYPEYTGLKAELVENGSGDISVLQGSRVWVELDFNKPVHTVQPQFGHAVAFDLERPDPMKAQLSFTVVRDNTYSLRLYDGQGLYNDPQRQFAIHCIPDKPPLVEILAPGRDMDMPEDYQFPLRIRAEDDFGVAAVRLMVSLRGESFEAHELPLEEGSGKTVQDVAHSMDFSLEDIGPEDYVLYYALVLDTNTTSGPGQGRSRTFSIRIPSVFEYYKELESDQDYQEQELEKMLREQQQVRKQTAELAERVARNREMKWEDSKNLEELKQQQKEIAKKADRLQEEIRKNIEKMEKNDLISPEIMDKMRKIQEIFSEVADQELKKLMEEMSQISEKMKVTEQEKTLFKSSFDQKEFEKKLERTLELFKKLRQEQRMEALEKEARRLLEKQEELSREREELAKNGGSREEWETMAGRQDKLSAQAEALQQAIKDVASEIGQDDPQAGKLAERAAGSMEEEQVAQSMSQASNSMKKMDSSSAAGPMKKAEKGLQKAISQLNKASSKLKNSNKNAIETKLNESIDSALNLAVRLSDLHGASLDLTKVPANARKKGALVGEEVQELIPISSELMDNISAMSGMSFLMDNETLAMAGRLVTALTAYRDGISAGRWHLAGNLCRSSQAAVNGLVDKLMRIKQQVSSQDSGLGFEQFLDNLKSMLSRQKQMGNKMQMMSGQPESGMSPMMSQLRQQALQKMAMEQAMIRQSMEEMAKKMGDQGRLSSQLREMASQMGELEKQIRSGDLGRKAMERQEKLTERMLEATKALNTKKLSKKRESKEGVLTGDATDPGALPDTSGPQQEARRVEPAVRVELPSEFSDIVKAYFEALSVRGGIHGGEQ